MYDSSVKKRMKDAYKEEIECPLRELEKSKIGVIKELGNGVLGFQRGKGENLITACHHASEIFGTYKSAISVISELEDCFVVPVVDKNGFNYYKKFERDYSEIEHAPYFVKGYKGFSPKKMAWSYGLKEAPCQINEIGKQIEKSELIIDLHNSSLEDYLFISNKNQTLDSISDIPLYSGHLNYPYVLIIEGVYRCLTKKTILSYAELKGKSGIAIEVPIYKKSELRNFVKEEKIVKRIIKKIVGGKNEI